MVQNYGITPSGEIVRPTPTNVKVATQQDLDQRPNRRGHGYRVNLASVERSVAAVVSLAIDGESLPLDVARKLLDPVEQAGVAVQARAIIESRPLEPDVLDIADGRLADLDKAVVGVVRSS